MKTYLDCIPCFMRQSLDAVRMVSDDPDAHEEVLRRVMDLASRMDFRRPPPSVGQKIHRIIRGLTGVADPYHEVKDRFNQFALRLYPELKKRIETSEDPFATAVRLAIAGNMIDFGLNSEITEKDLKLGIGETLAAPLDAKALEELREMTSVAKGVLYIADNAGEIVFDRLLIEELLPGKVTVSVRGHPVINDATRSDTEAAGLAGLVEIIDNGSDAPGTILEDCSEGFRQRFHKADLVIAKGQGNYETLSDAEREIFFLLKAKCPVIADDIGCEPGSIVIARKIPLESAPRGTVEDYHAGA